MDNIVTAAVIRLEAEGWPEPVYAHRRWQDPQPGKAVIVVSAADDWAMSRTTATLPALKVLTYANPSTGQADSEAIALEVADKVRGVLHRPQRGTDTWGDLRILTSMHVGSGLAEVLGHESWRVRSLFFEVQQG